jgi:hypothetical protein
MANSTIMNGGFIEISLDTGGASDWIWNDTSTHGATTPISKGMRELDTWMVKCIYFIPSAANDVMIVRNGGIDNAPVFHVKVADTTDQRRAVYHPYSRMAPVIDASDCTIGGSGPKIGIEIA